MMYHLKSLIAAHRAKLVVATLTYMLYNAIDPMGSEHAGFAVAAFVMMVVMIITPSMIFAAHLDKVKPGKVASPVRRAYIVHSNDNDEMNDDAPSFNSYMNSCCATQAVTGDFLPMGMSKL